MRKEIPWINVGAVCCLSVGGESSVSVCEILCDVAGAPLKPSGLFGRGGVEGEGGERWVG